MRFALTLPLLAALALPLTGCFDRGHKKGCDPAPVVAVNQLGAGQWFLADRANGVETYRPQHSAGWIRDSYVFAANGTLTATWAGPTDGPVSTTGTWSQQGNAVTITLAATAASGYPYPARTFVWQIQSLSAIELKVTR